MESKRETSISNEILFETNLHRTIVVDDRFPERMTKIKQLFEELIVDPKTICKKPSKLQLKSYERIKSTYDVFMEKADCVWKAYLSRDLTHAIQPRYKFNGYEIKKTYFLPTKNVKLYCSELQDAIRFVHNADPNSNADVETIKLQFTYHHRGYIYLLTSEAETQIGKKIVQGRWIELKRLSSDYERIGNIFLNQITQESK